MKDKESNDLKLLKADLKDAEKMFFATFDAHRQVTQHMNELRIKVDAVQNNLNS